MRSDQPEGVQACPECDSSSIRPTPGDQTAQNWACPDCETTFDEPVRRESRGPHDGVNPETILARYGAEDLVTDGGQPPETMVDISLFAAWHHKAETNVETWGLQDAGTLLLAMQEELGELTQAHLEATHEDGDRERLHEELADLGALLLQLHMRLNSDASPPECPRLRSDGGHIDVCPECDSSKIKRRVRADTRWRCQLCDERFDEPDQREPHHDGGAGAKDILARLGAEHLMEDNGGGEA